MVYDEAIDFYTGNKNTKDFSSYFSFLRYSSNNRKTLQGVTSKHYSHCYQTLLGWFHTENNKWGCFYGNKLVENYQLPTNGEASDKKTVLENSIEPAFYEINSKFQNIENYPANNLDNISDINLYKNYFNEYSSFLQIKTKTFFKLNSNFKNHLEVVERINSLNLSWKAQALNQFKDMTVKEINKMSGRKSKFINKNKFHKKQIHEENLNAFSKENINNVFSSKNKINRSNYQFFIY